MTVTNFHTDATLTREDLQALRTAENFSLHWIPANERYSRPAGAYLSCSKKVMFGGTETSVSHDIPCGAGVTDYSLDRFDGREGDPRPGYDDTWDYQYSAFGSLWQRDVMHTLADCLKVGDRLALRFIRGNSSSRDTERGICLDHAELRVRREKLGKDQYGCQRELVFRLLDQVHHQGDIEACRLVRRERIRLDVSRRVEDERREAARAALATPA